MFFLFNLCGRKKCCISCIVKFFLEVVFDCSRRRVFFCVFFFDVVDLFKVELSGLDGGFFCCILRVLIGGLVIFDVLLRSEISVLNCFIICFCSFVICWSYEIICEWLLGWFCGKRFCGVECYEYGL